jgi:hypothetical protein
MNKIIVAPEIYIISVLYDFKWKGVFAILPNEVAEQNDE